MEQKIVMEVQTNDDLKRCSRALRSAVGIPGTTSAVRPFPVRGKIVHRIFSDISGGVHENMEKEDEEGGGEKKDEGGGGEGGGGSEKKDKGGGGEGGGGSEKKDKPDDSEKKDKEGGGGAGEKNDKANGELRKMGANKVYGGWFMYGPGTCAEAVLHEPKQEEWLLTVTIHL